MTPELSIFYILFGSILLLAGWRLFWLFVGSAGFIAGLDLAQYAFGTQPQVVMIAAAVVCGLVGIILAIFFQEIIIVLAGALAGATLALHWSSFFVPFDPNSSMNTVVLITGALIGGIFMAWGFNIAIMIFSSLLGASLIVGVLPVAETVKFIVAVCLVVIGVIAQSSFSDLDKKKRKGTDKK